MEKYNEIVALIETIKADAEKFFIKENNAAGTRLRKGLKSVGDAVKGLRKHVSETRETRKNSEDAAEVKPTTES